MGLYSGVITTVVEMTGEEIKCEDCYVVISSYSSLKKGNALYFYSAVYFISTLHYISQNRIAPDYFNI